MQPHIKSLMVTILWKETVMKNDIGYLNLHILHVAGCTVNADMNGSFAIPQA